MLFLVPSIRPGKTDTHRRYLQKGGREEKRKRKKPKDGGRVEERRYRGACGREKGRGGQVTSDSRSGLTV